MRKATLALSMSAALLIGSSHAQSPLPNTTTAPVLKAGVVSTSVAVPQRIYRRIPTVSSTTKPTLTYRMLSPALIAQQINTNLNIDVNRLRLPRWDPPGKTALVVIMENGGIMSNLDPSARQLLNRNFTTVRCATFEFQLRPNQSLASLIAELGGALAGAVQCLDPRNWRQETINPYNVLDDFSDSALEDAVTGASSLLGTQTKYDRVVVLQDADAVPARVVAMIRSLAREYTMDIHVLTHGTSEAFFGHNLAAFNESSFFLPLRNDRNRGQLHLRAVYQMNCVSGTLKDNWIGLGAVVVNGTRQQYNNSMPHQYFHFLSHWLGERGMADASQRSFDEAATYTRAIYAFGGPDALALVDQSRLTAQGTSVNATVESAL